MSARPRRILHAGSQNDDRIGAIFQRGFMSQVRTLEQVASSVKGWTPVTAAERKAVREQLERILASPRFGKSKRCPVLFRYIVNRTLNGDSECLKERTLGIQVFGRDPDYDTNADPVVRMTAGEIRKRIAQYYHEAGHEDELRIDLPSGSYVPEFHLSLQTAITRVEQPAHRAANRWILVTALAILAVSSAVAFSLQPWKHASAVDVFWQPITSAETPVLVCVGPPDRRSVGAAPMEESDPARPEKAPSVLDLLRSDSIPLADSVTLAR